jgi:GT2 family glycosyltransferase
METLFAYVVLHYNTIEDTKQCVASIRENSKDGTYKIIIIDNCSPNHTGEQLKKLYGHDNDVYIILSPKNEGFARGNNLGFKYAKQELHAKYIVMMNNDTKLLHGNFCQLVEEEYEQSHCAVIGPKVITPNPPFDSNPGRKTLPTVTHISKQIFIMYVYLFLTYLHIDNWVHMHLGIQEKRRMEKAKKGGEDKREENVQLHGCFWVFTPTYINKFDGLNDKTFLYNEEPLLFARILHNGMKTVFLPSIEIFHKEDSATNSINPESSVKQRRFRDKCLIESLWVLRRELITNK